MARIFDFSAERTLAACLSDGVVKELPPQLMTERRKVLSVNKISRLLEKTYAIAVEYQKTHQSGFVRRAVLANGFKWNLKNHNYPDDFIEIATEGLVVSLTNARSKR